MQPDPEQSIAAAAKWLSITPDSGRPHPIIPHLQHQFALSAVQAVQAIRAAKSLREAGSR
jgi:hypothetical protein